MAQTQQQQQYVTSLLGDPEKVTNFHDSLKKWYYEEDKPNREKRLQQDAENEQKRVEIKKAESLEPFIAAAVKAGVGTAKLAQTLDKWGKKQELKAKSEFFKKQDLLDRSGEGVYDINPETNKPYPQLSAAQLAVEEQEFQQTRFEYSQQKKDLLANDLELKKRTAHFPRHIAAQYQSRSAREILWTQEYMAGKLIPTLTFDQFRHEMQVAGKLDTITEDNQHELYKTWVGEKVDPYENSDGLLSDVLYKPIQRLFQTSRGKQNTARQAVMLSSETYKHLERQKVFLKLDNNTSSEFVKFEIDSKVSTYTKEGHDAFNADRKAQNLPDLTMPQRAVLELTPIFLGLAATNKLDDSGNLAKFMQGTVTIGKGENAQTVTIEKFYFSDEKVGAPLYQKMVEADTLNKNNQAEKRRLFHLANLKQMDSECALGQRSAAECTGAAQNYINLTGDSNNDIVNTLNNRNYNAVQGTGLEHEKLRFNQINKTGAFMSPDNISAAGKIAHKGLWENQKALIEKTKKSQELNIATFLPYKRRLELNRSAVMRDNNTLFKTSLGDQRLEQFAIYLTNLEESLYQNHLNVQGGERDTTIGQKVTNEMVLLKQQNGFFRNSDERLKPGENSSWSFDGQTNDRSTFYRTQSGLDENINLQNTATYDQKFQRQQKLLKPGENFTEQLANSPLMDFDVALASVSGSTGDGFRSTAQGSYYSASLKNISEREFLKRQGNRIIAKSKEKGNEDLRERVVNSGFEAKIKRIDTSVEDKLLDLAKKSGDQFLVYILGTGGVSNITPDGWTRLAKYGITKDNIQSITPSSNLEETRLKKEKRKKEALELQNQRAEAKALQDQFIKPESNTTSNFRPNVDLNEILTSENFQEFLD